jgi:hypothetical protein
MSGSTGATTLTQLGLMLGAHNAKNLSSHFGTSSEQWFKDAEFKIFCASCWDEAKAICGGFGH